MMYLFGGGGSGVLIAFVVSCTQPLYSWWLETASCVAASRLWFINLYVFGRVTKHQHIRSGHQTSARTGALAWGPGTTRSKYPTATTLYTKHISREALPASPTRAARPPVPGTPAISKSLSSAVSAGGPDSCGQAARAGGASQPPWRRAARPPAPETPAFKNKSLSSLPSLRGAQPASPETCGQAAGPGTPAA